MASFAQRLDIHQPRPGTSTSGLFNNVRSFTGSSHAAAEDSSGKTPGGATDRLRHIIEAAALLGQTNVSEEDSADSRSSELSAGASSETREAVETPRVASFDPAKANYGTGTSETGSDLPPGDAVPAPPPPPTGTPCRSRKRKKCERHGCPKRPSFAKDGENPARCASHKLEQDVNVKHRQCATPFCTLRCRFGRPGSKPVHCILHREPDEIDPFRRLCVFPGCRVTPTFSLEGKRPERCASHKIEGDINTNRQSCGEPHCGERSCFFNSTTGVKHCRSHFAEGDSAGLRGMCQSRDPGGSVPCNKYATFSAVKGRPLRCKDHRLADDVDVLNRMCEAEGCRKRPSFAGLGRVARRCKSHALDGDVNVTGKRCSIPSCDTIVGIRTMMCKAHRG